MGTYSKIVLSGSTDGRPIIITATAPSTANLIHTCVTGSADSIDELWLYAQPQVTTALLFSLSLGPTTVTARLRHTITADDKKGLVLIAPGLVGKASGVWGAWVTTTSIVEVWGFVNRYAS